MEGERPQIDAQAFYRDYYFHGDDESGERLAEWRSLSARRKANHVRKLCLMCGLVPETILEVGCGDGAVLEELSAQGLGLELYGCDLSSTALELASERGIQSLAGLMEIDGGTIPAASGCYDLSILSHVLEHADEPIELLKEAARVGRHLVVEVPLEENASARRKREMAAGIGHINFYSLVTFKELLGRAGLGVEAELLDPLGLKEQSFFASSVTGKAAALGKAAVRRALFIGSSKAASRLFTLHYAAICSPRRS